ncbi:DUF1919 domain-containing protein, partial [bacterium]|nr:DUF1919 domain-containing protein [bacterium]
MNILNKYITKIKDSTLNKLNDVYCRRLRKQNKNLDFTIISNNCWGGGIYEDLNLKYNSPTVGLFFYAPCYIEFL